jgi:hypothetical protein
LARAKNTQRAAARRRYKQEIRPNSLADDAYLDDDDPAQARSAAAGLPVAGTPLAPARSGIAGMFSRPDVRGDIRAFPQMMLTNKRLWIPFALLLLGLVVTAGYSWGQLPPDSFNLAALAFTLVLSPQALFVPFIGGFLAPRGAYLVGALIGVFDAVMITILALGPIQTDRTLLLQQATQPGDLIAIFIVAILFATFAAAFASWYRRFLRNSQDRAKANRAIRDQQMAAKRKEDDRKARMAERDARRSGSSRKSTP